MTRRLILLNGLAIIAVVVSHTADWGFLQLTELSLNNWLYVVLLMMTKLASFCVPAFLFASGAFAVYADRERSGQTSLVAAIKVANWRAVRQRVAALLWPYMLWSVWVFLWLAGQGITFSLAQYVSWMIAGGAVAPYYYVPMLCQFVLLSPIIIWLARRNAWALLIGAAAIQFGVMGLQYWNAVQPVPLVGHWFAVNRHWSFFPTWILFFVLGVLFGCKGQSFKAWIVRHRQGLTVGVVVFGSLAIVEAQWLIDHAHVNWRYSPLTMTSLLYSLCFVLAFMAYEGMQPQLVRVLNYLSTRTFGIYLIHEAVLKVGAKVVDTQLHWLATYTLIYTCVLTAVAIVIPLMLMAAVLKSPARRYYRYLFG